ncbi:MAG: hypothetical protein LC130_23220 [Bryobacterales bacterium]|nr:hypothetical protein [Bryobacterales bacterium]
MTTLAASYGTSTAFTITLNSLAASASAGRESTAIDNTSNLYVDALVSVWLTLAAGTPSLGIYVYVYGSEDGTNYPDAITGSDAAYTLKSPTNLTLLKPIWTATSGGLLWRMNPMGIAWAFGGILPRKWGIVVLNNTSRAAASSGNGATYTGIKYTNS